MVVQAVKSATCRVLPRVRPPPVLIIHRLYTLSNLTSPAYSVLNALCVSNSKIRSKIAEVIIWPLLNNKKVCTRNSSNVSRNSSRRSTTIMWHFNAWSRLTATTAISTAATTVQPPANGLWTGIWISAAARPAAKTIQAAQRDFEDARRQQGGRTVITRVLLPLSDHVMRWI